MNLAERLRAHAEKQDPCATVILPARELYNAAETLDCNTRTIRRLRVLAWAMWWFSVGMLWVAS